MAIKNIEEITSKILRPFVYQKYGKAYIGDKETEGALRIEGVILHTIEILEKEIKELIEEIIPEEDRPKLGSENQDEYVAYANGYNDCIKDIKSKLPWRN